MQTVHLLFRSRSELLLLRRKPCSGFGTRPDASCVQHFTAYFGNGLVHFGGTFTLGFTTRGYCALLIKRQKHLDIILSRALRSLTFLYYCTELFSSIRGLALAGQVSHPHDELAASLVLDGHITQFLVDSSRVLCLWSHLWLLLLYGVNLALGVSFDVVTLLILWRRDETSTLAVLSVYCGGARILDPEMLRRQFDRFELVHVQRLDQGVALLLGHSDVVRSALIVGIFFFLSLLMRFITWSCLHLN